MYGISGDPDSLFSSSPPDPTNISEDKEEVCYLMTRPSAGGTILGGCYQKGNWSGEVDKGLSRRIMRRAVEVCPGLVPDGKGVEGLEVIKEGVGLRPVREEGVRLEVEEVGVLDEMRNQGASGGKVTVVHNYGHGGFGYQSSYGCAERLVELVEGVVSRDS